MIQDGQYYHKGPYRKETGGSELERKDANMEAEVTEERRCYFLALKMEEGDHKPRNVGKL